MHLGFQVTNRLLFLPFFFFFGGGGLRGGGGVMLMLDDLYYTEQAIFFKLCRFGHNFLTF